MSTKFVNKTICHACNGKCGYKITTRGATCTWCVTSTPWHEFHDDDCEYCNGTGSIPVLHDVKCNRCQGKGFIEY